jgi:hypothetical protein
MENPFPMAMLTNQRVYIHGDMVDYHNPLKLVEPRKKHIRIFQFFTLNDRGLSHCSCFCLSKHGKTTPWWFIAVGMVKTMINMRFFLKKKTCLRSSHPSTESTGNSLNSQILRQIYDDLCICSEAWSLSEKPVSGLPHPAV